MPAQPQALGVLAALGSAASWAVGAFLFKALGERLSPLAMTLAKGVCSVGLLGIVLVLLGGESMAWRPLLLLAVSGLLGIALGDTFFFEALQGIGPQPLLVLMVVGQVLTALLAVVFLGEQQSAAAWLGVALVVAGVAVVLHGALAQEEGQATKRRGVLFGLLSVVCMAAGSVVAKAGLGEGAHTLQATFVRMAAGTLGVFCFGAAAGRIGGWMTPFRNPKLLVSFGASVAIITFGGFWLGMVAFKYTTVAAASSLTSTEPIFALILAAVLLRERVTLQAAAGTAVAMVGVVFLSLPRLWD